MRLVSLKLKNYRQHEDTFVEFPDGLIGIIGLNGAGKSSLIESIAWTLFGSLAARTDKEGIKRTSAPANASVETSLEIELNGNYYKVQRILKGDKQTALASIIANGKVIADTTKACDKEIEYLLGMDYKSFYTSFFARQKELNALTDLNPNQRRDIIIRMLRIDAIDKTIDMIRSDSRDQKMQAEVLKKSLKDPNLLESQKIAQEKKLGQIQGQLQKLEKELEKQEQVVGKFKDLFANERKIYEKYNELENQIIKHKTKLKQGQKQAQDIKKELENIKELENKIKTIRQSTKDLENLEKEKKALDLNRENNLVKAQEHLTTIEKSLSENSAHLKILREKYKEIADSKKQITSRGKNAACPTCHRELGNDFEKIISHFDEELNKITKEADSLKKENDLKENQKIEISLIIKNLRQNLPTKTTALQISLFQKEYNPKELTDIQDKIKAAQKAKDEYVRLSAQIEQKPKLKDEEQKINREIEQIQQTLEKLEKEQNELKYNKEEHSKITRQNEEEKEKLRILSQNLSQSKIELVSCEKEIEKFDAEIKNIESTKKAIEKLAQSQTKITQLTNIMDEYRTHLISRIQPELSKTASDLFITLTDGKYSGIELDDKYDLFIYDGNIKYPLSRFSGGEADLANLCLRLAISQLISASAGIDGGFIILDEIFGSQDDIRKNSILNALAKLSKQYRQIIIITHIEDIKDSLEAIIEVKENEQGTSQVKQI